MAVVLTHPHCYTLLSVTERLIARATAASDTDQSTAITLAFTEAKAAKDAGNTIQPHEFTPDSPGHLGRHLKWLLSAAVYRALTNADISADLDAIATEAGVV